MAVTRCSQGHYYDDQKFSRCPHCGIFTNMAVQKQAKQESPKNTPVDDLDKTLAFQDVKAMKDDDIKTVGFYSDAKGNDFVTGWLVCIKGPQKGRDYRLHHGFNRIGRGYGMEICIEDDKMISRECHCSIAYDAKSNTFSLVPSAGAITYRNKSLIQQPLVIVNRDIIEIGESEFEFVAFCSEGRVW